MLTVTQLARKFDLSRTTILYYEREGLLSPYRRSEKRYRLYGDKEIKRLKAIVAYRSYGVPIKDIVGLLDENQGLRQETVLRKQFSALETEIQTLRQQQKTIITLLEEPALLKQQSLDKERWREIMKAAGIDEDVMENWHQQFEKMEPDAHQAFCKTLEVDKDQINQMHTNSRN